MKELSLAGVFKEKNNAENFWFSKEIVEGTKGTPFKMQKLKSVICAKPRIQLALMSEIISREYALSQNPDLQYGFNCTFFADFDCTYEPAQEEAVGEERTGEENTKAKANTKAEMLLQTLQGIYGRILYIKDKGDGSIFGYQTTNTFAQSREAAVKLYNEGKIDKLIAHFMSPERGYIKCMENGAIMLEKAERADDTFLAAQDELLKSGFYRELENGVKHLGEMCFIVNGFDSRELAEDLYIQVLTHLYNEVYICSYKDDGCLCVVVR